MAVREILLPWESQPQEEAPLNERHPLFAHLGAVFRADAACDALSGLALARSGALQPRASRGGLGFDHTTSSLALYRTVPAVSAQVVWVAGVLVPDVTTSLRKWAVALRSTTGTGTALAISQGNLGDGLPTFAIRRIDGGTLLELTAAGTTMAVGAPAVVFAISRSRTDHSLYVGGARYDFSTDAGTSVDFAATVFAIGASYQTSATIGFDGVVPLGMFGVGDPGDEAIFEWLSAPWRIFAEQRIIIPRAAAGGAAALEAAPTISAAATADLTTAIQVASAAVVSGEAAGSLSTAIQAAGAAQIGGAAEGALLTSIDPQGAAVVAGLAGGDLTAQIRLDGEALAAALAAAGLTTSTDLAGDAGGAVDASGGITTVIRLPGDAVAAVLATGDLTAPGSGLAGAATAGVSAAGEITTQIQVQGGPQVSVLASSDLSTGISMAGAAVGIVTGTGDLVIALRLDAAAVMAALAGASLTTQVVMQGAAVMGAQAAGALTTQSGAAAPGVRHRTVIQVGSTSRVRVDAARRLRGGGGSSRGRRI